MISLSSRILSAISESCIIVFVVFIIKTSLVCKILFKSRKTRLKEFL